MLPQKWTCPVRGPLATGYYYSSAFAGRKGLQGWTSASGTSLRFSAALLLAPRVCAAGRRPSDLLEPRWLELLGPRHLALTIAPASCPVLRAFRKLAGPFGYGKWGSWNALYFHQASKFSEVLLNWISLEPHKTKEGCQGSREGSPISQMRSRRDGAKLGLLESLCRRVFLFPETHPPSGHFGHQACWPELCV